ncbi:hypothetical protein KTO58_26460 [Chitinophaga pendula]|uniref:hypothetical protein n=1 Tax=Chitinophaga TaxID=79328 RepID=UPI0012FE5253|nr:MULTISPECIES: hypothetical protein [Chitinophaga]UCJ07165.1 hypothetical protein KTO58_26460 [Chitinophaga pendula]
MKKTIVLSSFEALGRRALGGIQGGGGRLAAAVCNTGKACSVWAPSCGDGGFVCYCDYKFGIIGTCKGI